jgi:hypothetical protein
MNKTRKNKCKIFLVTVSTKQHINLERWKESAEIHGFKPIILGLHEKKEYNDPIIGSAKFGMKLRYLLEYLKKKEANDIILFTDAWDVIIIDDSSKILKTYKSFRKDIVFGGEKGFCLPDFWNFYKYDFTKPFPFLNSGVIIGKAGTMKTLLEKYTEKDIKDSIDDQVLWRKIYLENKDKITIDYTAKLILNTSLTSKNDYIFKNNTFTYKETNTNPSIIHAQGPEVLGFKSYLELFK